MFALVSMRGFVFAVFSSIKVPPKKIMNILVFLKRFCESKLLHKSVHGNFGKLSLLYSKKRKVGNFQKYHTI